MECLVEGDFGTFMVIKGFKRECAFSGVVVDQSSLEVCDFARVGHVAQFPVNGMSAYFLPFPLGAVV